MESNQSALYCLQLKRAEVTTLTTLLHKEWPEPSAWIKEGT